MIRDFFLDKFEYDMACNQAWIKCITQQSDLANGFIDQSFSHIINVHHRWICRLEGTPEESGLHDRFDPSFWLALCTDNFQRTILYLEHTEFDGVVNYFSEDGEPLEKVDIDILYHILNHSNYHRAQIARELRRLDITPPSLNFISYH